VLTHAYKAGASGYLAGRAIWLQPFRQFPEWDDIRAALRRDAVPYMKDLNTLTDTRAMPWFAHACYGGAVKIHNPDGGFRHAYQGF
jgi:tagatose 1,6-diphosphate aldolase